MDRFREEGFIMTAYFRASSCQGKHLAMIGQAVEGLGYRHSLFLLYTVWASDGGMILPMCSQFQKHTQSVPRGLTLLGDSESSQGDWRLALRSYYTCWRIMPQGSCVLCLDTEHWTEIMEWGHLLVFLAFQLFSFPPFPFTDGSQQLLTSYLVHFQPDTYCVSIEVEAWVVLSFLKLIML